MLHAAAHRRTCLLVCVFVLMAMVNSELQEQACISSFGTAGRCVVAEICPRINSLVNSVVLSPRGLNEIISASNACPKGLNQLFCCANSEIVQLATTTARPVIIHAPRPTKSSNSDGFCLQNRLDYGNDFQGASSLTTSFGVFIAIGKRKSFRCVGSLITHEYVLTAAHCTPDQDPAEYTLFVNAYDVSKDKSGKLLADVEPSFVHEVIPHEKYSETSLVHDIALLRLNESVPVGSKSLPQPVCVPMDPVNDEVASVGHALRCFGWGYNAEGVLSTTKLWVTLQRISLEDCLERFSNMPSRQPNIADVSERNICTVTISGHDAYAGYSGGPLMYHKGGRWFLIGVISYGVGAISNKFPVVSTNVQQYTDWILSKINLDK